MPGRDTTGTLDPARARAIALAAQGLDREASFGGGPEGALRAIRRLGYVQVDTIAVIERAHHHVLHTRVPGYAPAMLDALTAERRVFEYWTHAAAILPMEHLPHLRPEMRWHRRNPGHWSAATPALAAAQTRILRRLRRDGPLAMRDLEATRVERDHLWSAGKLEKPALHELWMQGRVAVAGRRGFEKLYDLPERVWPAELRLNGMDADGAAEADVRVGLGALGVARPRDLHHLARPEKARAIRRAIARLRKSGEIREVGLGAEHRGWLAPTAALDTVPDAPEPRVRFLSPFDNLIIHRGRAKALFGLDYRLECYVPEARREFGYFALPVLAGDAFLGLVDMKAERDSGTLVVRKARLPGLRAGGRREFTRAAEAFAVFNRCARLRVEPEAGPLLRRWL